MMLAEQLGDTCVDPEVGKISGGLGMSIRSRVAKLEEERGYPCPECDQAKGNCLCDRQGIRI